LIILDFSKQQDNTATSMIQASNCYTKSTTVVKYSGKMRDSAHSTKPERKKIKRLTEE
jgi:hypothetical protein